MAAQILKKSLPDTVFDWVSSRIFDRKLTAGDSLPSERALCDQLGVNRGAIREAIKRLQQASLVEVRQGGATKVLDYLDNGGLELLPSLLVTSDGNVRVDVARSIVSMRQSMAPDIARACALNRSDQQLRQLQNLLSQMQAVDRSDLEALQVLAFAYWQELVNGSGNIAYRLALNSMNKAYIKIWPLLVNVLAQELQDLETLEALTAAVESHDGEAAASLASRYLLHGSEAMQNILAALDIEQNGQGAEA